MALKSDAVFEKISTRLETVHKEPRTVEHVFQFNITSGGAVVKTWTLDLKAVKLIQGVGAGVECTLTCTDDDMVLLGTGGLTPKEAVTQDRLDVDGDLALALKLEPFIASLK